MKITQRSVKAHTFPLELGVADARRQPLRHLTTGCLLLHLGASPQGSNGLPKSGDTFAKLSRIAEAINGYPSRE